MSMLKLSFIFFGCLLMGKECVHAHSHDHVYIVEQVPPPVVVVQQPQPQPVVVVQQVPTAAINAPTFECPPADLVEAIPACPGDDYVWQKGHWQWNGSWVWAGGQWARRPNNYSAYVPGYWRLSKHHHRWEWVAPYWK